MTTHQILVENIKCNGCVNTIKTQLSKMKGVRAVEIFIEDEKICVSGIAIHREEMVTKLATLGYPEKGNNSLLNRAKSFVSCAVGNLNNKREKIHEITNQKQNIAPTVYD